MANDKLGRPSKERKALLRNQVTNLLWYGKIETTVAKAKSVRSIAEKLLTAAINSYEDTVEVTVSKKGLDGVVKEVKVVKDGGKKLAARRKIMSKLNDLQEVKPKNESKSDFKERTKGVNHPLIEKIFNELAPKYADRAKELGQGGGYTRIYLLGERRGDATERAIIELV